MCKLTYWVNNKEGFIATCQQCHRYHITFGTAMIVADKTGFENIAREVSNLLQGERPCNPLSKYAAIKTGCENSFIVLSWGEAILMNEMIESCTTEMTTLALIDLLENG